MAIDPSDELTQLALPVDEIGSESSARVPERTRRARLIAIGGGKGGVGKSLLAANLGIELAARGVDTVVVDCDLGGANLHTYLGMEHPRASVSAFLTRAEDDLSNLVVETPIRRLGLLSGARNAITASNPMYQQKRRLLRALRAIDADCLILDLEAGSSFNTLDFFNHADDGIVLVVPEPTSIENAYRFLKASFLRRLRFSAATEALQEIVAGAEVASDEPGASPRELVASAYAYDPAAGREAEVALAGFRPAIVVNLVREAPDLTLGPAIRAAARRLLGIELRLLGHIHHDPHAWRALRAGRALLLERFGKPFKAELAQVADGLQVAACGSDA